MAKRTRGRPSQGLRISVRLPPPLLEAVDQRAERTGSSRADTIRSLLRSSLDPAGSDGVDREQIRRMLRLSPAERVAHMADAANRLSAIHGVARA